MTFRAPSRSAIRLFLTAMSILFVELLLIRWIPANVIYVGFFRNFLLMASFLGIGLGILWGRDPRRIQVSPFGPLLLALVVLVTQVQIVIHLDSRTRSSPSVRATAPTRTSSSCRSWSS